MNKLIRLFFASLSLPITGPAFADFAGMYVDRSSPVDISGDGVLYECHRVYVVLTDSTDRLISVAGLGQTGGAPLRFSAFDPNSPKTAPELFRSCVVPCDALSCSQTSQPVANLQGPYHSFVCMKSGDQPSDFPPFGDPINGLVNNLTFSPDVLCSASPNPVVVEGSSWTTGGIDGGYFPSDPVNGDSTGLLILIAQFTLPTGAEFEFQGNLIYNYTPPNFPGQIPGQTEFFVNSMDFNDLSECPTFDQFFKEFGLLLGEDPLPEWDQCGDGVFDFCQGLVATEIGSNSPSDCNGNGEVDICEFSLADIDRNDNLVPDTCECIADLDGDGAVNLSDIVTLLFAWGDTSPGELDVFATGKSQGIIDDDDLNTVLVAAVPPDTIEENSPLRPFLSGCGLLPAPSPLPAVVSDDVIAEEQSTLTREGLSDGLLPVDIFPSFVVPNVSDTDVSFPDRQPEDNGAIAQLRGVEQDSKLPISSELATKNNDALSKLFEILAPASQASQSEVVWDLDRDGLLDPWSVIVLPLSKWPDELKPFAEMLRP